MTVDEYIATPETVVPQELIYGEMRVAESPSPAHQRTVGVLYRALHEHVSEGRLGEVWLAPLDVILDRERALVVQPDLFFISEASASIVGERIEGAPDLVIEVLSPRPRIGEVAERVGWFATYGVRECWLVKQTEREVEVLELSGGLVASRAVFRGDEAVRSSVLPALRLTLFGIFGLW